MIRILYIGPAAAEWAERTRAAYSSLDVDDERLPAAAVRNFEQTPPDAVVFCWLDADARLQKFIDAIRSRPLGGLLPCVVVGAEDAEGVDASFPADIQLDELIGAIGEQVGVDLDGDALPNVEPAAPASDIRKTPHHPIDAISSAEARTPVDQPAMERKLREVRHSSYFDILEVSLDATSQDVREAFLTLKARFADDVPADLRSRFEAELDEVREALDDAYAVLIDDELRAAHAEGSGSHAR